MPRLCGNTRVVFEEATSLESPHALPYEKVASELETDPVEGLTHQEAEKRLRKYGPNKISEPPPERFYEKVWRQLNSVLVLILTIAGIVSGVFKQWPEFGLIFGVIFLNTLIGLWQEGKANAATNALKGMLSSAAHVIRSGERIKVPAESLVIGDLVFIESGDKIPADIRIVQATGVQVLEAMLTGESLAVTKVPAPVEANVPLGDRESMGYSATLVVKGQGTGIVVGTGDRTQIGQISTLVNSVKTKRTNLQVQVEVFGRWIAFVTAPVALASFLLAYFTGETKKDAAQAFIVAVSIAVSMLPAGLPAIMTITLSLGMAYMARNNAVVKTLPSVETLGSVMVVCSDKTGTLTKNEMTVVAIRTKSHEYDFQGVGYDYRGGGVTPETHASDPVLDVLIKGGVLCNDAILTVNESTNEVSIVGDPTELSMLTASRKLGADYPSLRASHPRESVIPFESDHKFMGTVHGGLLYVKGAPDRLIARSAYEADGETPIHTQFWLDTVEELAGRGLRCVAVMTLRLDPSQPLPNTADFVVARNDFTFVGLFAILDPPRPECVAAVKEANAAGVQVKMITGDHPATAVAIGRTLGLLDAAIPNRIEVLTGAQLDAMTPEELAEVVLRCNIFARASPENKIQIVKALHAKHQVCSMTGDGVNDAPALRAADIGVAMGITGTDVSKEAAKVILTDDNFATIILAIREGRRIWDSLKKIIIFNQGANFSQGLSILMGQILAFEYTAFSPVQILYINLVTACTLGLAFAAEKAEPDVMTRPPRKRKARLVDTVFLVKMAYIPIMYTCFILGGIVWAQKLGYELPQQRALSFNTLIFCTIGLGLNCRFLNQASFHPRILRGNPVALFCSVLMAGLNVFATYTPGVNEFFTQGPIDGTLWGIVFLFAFAGFFVVEFEKLVFTPFWGRRVYPSLYRCSRACSRAFPCASNVPPADVDENEAPEDENEIDDEFAGEEVDTHAVHAEGAEAAGPEKLAELKDSPV